MTDFKLETLSFKELKAIHAQVKAQLALKQPPIKLQLRWLPLANQEKLKLKFKESSMVTVKNQILRLCRECFQMEHFDKDKFVNNSKLVLKVIAECKSNHSVVRNLIHVLKTYDLTIDEQKLIMPYERERNRLQAMAYSRGSAKQLAIAGDIEYAPMIKEYRAKYRAFIDQNPSIDNWVKYITLTLYAMVEPIRGGEYCKTKLVEYELTDEIDLHCFDEPNFICLNNKKLLIKDYKTYNSIGIREIPLCDELIEELKKYKAVTKSNWLLPLFSRPADHMSTSGLTHMLQNIFGAKIATQMLRKLFDRSEVIEKNLPATRREEIAHTMGHSAGTALLRYGDLCPTAQINLQHPPK